VSIEEQTLALANDVADSLAARGAKSAVIGAIAVAIHGYPRSTQDIDLATATTLTVLRQVASDLQARGCVVRLGEPDDDDPLGGVLTAVRGDADPVQVVNYANPFRPGSGALAAEAVESAVQKLGSLYVVDLPHLIALKLYAGGAKSKLDVVELLASNPAADRDAIAEVCAKHGLRTEWEELRRL
jgi:hypothetical protein